MENLTINPEEEDDGSEEQGDEAWDESQEGDEEEDATVSLFESTVLPSTEAAFQHDQNQHGFELRAYAAQVNSAVARQQLVLLMSQNRRHDTAHSKHQLPCKRNGIIKSTHEPCSKCCSHPL